MKLWIARIVLLVAFAIQWGHNLIGHTHHHQSSAVEEHHHFVDVAESSNTFHAGETPAPADHHHFAFAAIDHSYSLADNTTAIAKAAFADVAALWLAGTKEQGLYCDTQCYPVHLYNRPPPEWCSNDNALRGPPTS